MVNDSVQASIDSLKRDSKKKDTITIYPFNPNFITDYKGYTLGMSTIQIDRLHAFRDKGQFVNSRQEFQEVTQISDSLLQKMAPHFKFPDWVNQNSYPSKSVKKLSNGNKMENSSLKITDLNSATAAELKTINGIGEKLSARIIKFRDRLGGFLVNEQLYDVYGLEPEVVELTLEKFKVLNPPEIKKININTATAEEIATLVYLKYDVANNIVSYREKNGKFTSLKDLFNVSEFPINKTERIALYLQL